MKKNIQSQVCYHCNTQNFYYPLDNRDREVLVVNCCRCGRKNLIAGWEVSYTSEEEAKLEGISTIGSSKYIDIPLPENKQVEQNKPIVQQSTVQKIYEKTMDLSWIDGVLHQKCIDKYSRQEEWLPIQSNR